MLAALIATIRRVFGHASPPNDINGSIIASGMSAGPNFATSMGSARTSIVGTNLGTKFTR